MGSTRITSQDIRDGTIIGLDISLTGAINPISIANGSVTSGEFQQLNGIGSQADGISDANTLTNKTITGFSNNVAANYLLTATGVLPITGNAPTSGQVLTAGSGGSLASWQTPGGGLATSNFVFNEVPAGTVDGNSDAFNLANTASSSGSIKVYKNGIRQTPGAGNDFHCNTTGIRFLPGNFPQTNDNVLVDYLK